MERATGIEPVSLAWKAKVLPLHNARVRPKGIVEPRLVVKGQTDGNCVRFERKAMGQGAGPRPIASVSDGFFKRFDQVGLFPRKPAISFGRAAKVTVG